MKLLLMTSIFKDVYISNMSLVVVPFSESLHTFIYFALLTFISRDAKSACFRPKFSRVLISLHLEMFPKRITRNLVGLKNYLVNLKYFLKLNSLHMKIA